MRMDPVSLMIAAALGYGAYQLLGPKQKPVRLPSGATSPEAIKVTEGGVPTVPAGAVQPVLKQGSKGPAVVVWQKFLVAKKLLEGAADGDFGPKTKAATVLFQKSVSLTPDGVVGPNTWKAAGVVAATEAQTGAPMTKPIEASGAAVPVGAPGPSAPTSADWAALALGAREVSSSDFLGSGDESGRSWMLTLTTNMLERERQCIAAVEAGFLYPVPWVEVAWKQDGHTVKIWAAADAVLVGKTDPIRITVSHLAAQVMADRLNAMLPTSKMSNAAWIASGVKLEPSVLNATWASVKPAHKAGAGQYLLDMANNDTVCEHSDRVSQKRAAAGLAPYGSGLSRPVGKDWVSSERLLSPDGRPAAPSHSTIGGGGEGVAGANFGWQSPNGTSNVALGGVKVFQSIGLAHDWHHHDYSQVLTVYKQDCEIDGASRSVEEVLRNPALAYLLSDEVLKGTACRVWRHPAVSADPGGVSV